MCFDDLNEELSNLNFSFFGPADASLQSSDLLVVAFVQGKQVPSHEHHCWVILS